MWHVLFFNVAEFFCYIYDLFQDTFWFISKSSSVQEGWVYKIGWVYKYLSQRVWIQVKVLENKFNI